MSSKVIDFKKTVYNETIHFLESRFSINTKYSIYPSFFVYDEASFCIKVLPMDYGDSVSFILVLEKENGERLFIHVVKIGARKNEGIASMRKKVNILKEILDNIEIIKNVYKKCVFINGLYENNGDVVYMKVEKDMKISLGTSHGFIVLSSDIRKDIQIKFGLRDESYELLEMNYDKFMSLDSIELVEKAIRGDCAIDLSKDK